MKYDHGKIEKKWREAWEKSKIYSTPDSVPGKDNFYLLVEFPYPSGNLHVGHWYAFALPDILARKKRMEGKNVMYPIGFDAFGLPAENAAIKNNLNPRKWTEGNIEYMRTQIRSMGTMFDWSREVQTIDPEYYKWTQWLFLQFYKKGLVYQKETAVNWCPTDKTVLANEQVVDGRCERCESEVVQRQMLQWNIKITEYADRLLDDLEGLDWPQQIKESQRNWIGRSEGAEIDFPLDLGQKYKYVILHGFESAPDRPRWIWAKEKLEEMGHEGVLPRLPSPDEPREDERGNTALNATTYDEHTVLVGHSLGAVAALKVAEKLEKPVARLVTVGGFVDPEFKDSKEKKRNFTDTWSWKFDAEKIRRSARSITLLHDPRDYAVRDEQAKALADMLGVTVTTGVSNEPHFTGDTEPDVVMWLRPTVRIFTTRPDTLFGATYLVLAPEHPLLRQGFGGQAWSGLVKNWSEVQKYIAQAAKKTELERQTEKEKTGVRLEGVSAANPATGERIPLFIADYVLGQYGTGAIMGVPAHDERDFEFAHTFGLPVREVVAPGTGRATESQDLPTGGEGAYTGDGSLVNSGELDGMTVEEWKKAITEKYGRAKKTYKLRDWIVSRQRYWGVPIPVIHCEQCGHQPVPEDELPVQLPDVEDYLPTGEGRSPLAKIESFVQVKCPKCGGAARRETDTLDTFVDSSWYFLRYTDPKNSSEFASRKSQDAWMPVDLYSGGAEHTTMHLLYSRFWHKAMYDLGLVSDREPYTRRMNRSLILGPDGQKMSKSRGNVVDPDEVVARLGADTVRMYLAFIGPYNEVSDYPWNPNGVVGVRRFLERVHASAKYVGASTAENLLSLLHRTIKKVGDDIDALKFNTAISQMMIFQNALDKEKAISTDDYLAYLRVLAPFAPHLAEELWHGAGAEGSVHTAPWPSYEEALLREREVTIAIQINGKTRGEVRISADADEASHEASAEEVVRSRLTGVKKIRTIVVIGRLVNFVVRSE